MNQRLQELLQQSTDNILGVPIVDQKKFAELIVADVLDEVLQAMDDGMDVYDTVASKFGVEE